MDELQKMAINCAIRDMMRKGYFSICVIDQILKMTGGIPDKRDYEVLRLLHCINFVDMQPELLRGLPLIMNRVINADDFGMSLDVSYRARMMLTT
jgi:hypothetical protein